MQLLSLPEGWFLTSNEVHQNPWDHVSWRYIRIQNGYNPDSKALIYTQEEHEFSLESAEQQLRKAIDGTTDD